MIVKLNVLNACITTLEGIRDDVLEQIRNLNNIINNINTDNYACRSQTMILTNIQNSENEIECRDGNIDQLRLTLNSAS